MPKVWIPSVYLVIRYGPLEISKRQSCAGLLSSRLYLENQFRPMHICILETLSRSAKSVGLMRISFRNPQMLVFHIQDAPTSKDSGQEPRAKGSWMQKCAVGSPDPELLTQSDTGCSPEDSLCRLRVVHSFTANQPPFPPPFSLKTFHRTSSVRALLVGTRSPVETYGGSKSAKLKCAKSLSVSTANPD